MAKKSVSGPSGAHRSPRRLLSQSKEALAEQDAAAARAGLTWADWARAALARHLTCRECERLDALCYDCRMAERTSR